jgi:hypothetical protein
VGTLAVAIAIGVGLVFVALATGVWDSATQDDGRQSLANFVAVSVLSSVSR